MNFGIRVWNEKDLSVIDELLHPDIVIHSPLGNFYGLESMKKIVAAWFTAYPDLIVKQMAAMSENDLAIIHWEAKGTHKGEFKGRQPTGKKVAYDGVTVYRIREGKIVEYWAYLDMHYLLSQISSL